MEQIKKIDLHAHVTAFPQYTPSDGRGGKRMVGVEELLRHYDALNIERGVLLPLSSPEGQWVQTTNAEMKWVTERIPDRFSWFCNVDPRAGNNSEKSDLGFLLEYYRDLGAKGVGELTAHLYADEPRMENLFACCAALKMPVTVHIAPDMEGGYGIVDGLGLARLERMLKKYPDLIILGHSQPFWAEIGELTPELRNAYPTGKVKEGRLAALLREYGNLYCDLSAGSGANAMMRDREYAARFIEEFSERIYYACDIFSAETTFPYSFSEFLDSMRAAGEIREEDYGRIVRENAVRLLGL